jgi:MFS family permease
LGRTLGVVGVPADLVTSRRAATASAAARLGVRRLLRLAGYRRLLISRFAAQWGDGLFQTGLASAVLFDPERAPDPTAIAAGFAVLLLPYSLIGPFAGALLDRWDRRRVLLVGNLTRGVMILLTATAVATGLPSFPLYVGALIAVGISRFVDSGLSAALPHVVPTEYLVEGNAVATTLGAVISVVGAGSAVGLRAVFGSDNLGSGLVTACAVVGSVLAAGAMARFAPGDLGPDTTTQSMRAVVAVARGLLDGARAVLRVPSVTGGFVALFAHRAAFGASLLVTVMLLRYSFHSEGILRAGLPGLGEAALAGGAGILLAGLLTRPIVSRFGRRATIIGGLVLLAATEAGLGLPMVLPSILLASFLLNAVGQVVKLCVDSTLQQDIPDETRGRVFAVYDMVLNATQAIAIGIAALVTPLDGRAIVVVIAATVLYLLGLAGYVAVVRGRVA